MASNAVEARLHAVHAGGRIADALLGVALDVMEPFASEYLSAEEYDRLRCAAEAPVKAATQAALATLTSQLDLMLDSNPQAAARFNRAQHRHP
jgi:hypothetical protein